MDTTAYQAEAGILGEEAEPIAKIEGAGVIPVQRIIETRSRTGNATAT